MLRNLIIYQVLQYNGTVSTKFRSSQLNLVSTVPTALWLTENKYIARGMRARVSVNFRKFSPCMALPRRARAGLTVYPPSQTWRSLDFAFDEYWRFDTSAFFMRIKRGSLYTNIA
jgi:hypothetical protein